MKLSLACLVFILGCQRGETQQAEQGAPAATPSGDYAKDVLALCESMTRSGADKLEPAARQLTIATWLGENLKTTDSRKFLVRIQPLQGEAKAAALEEEAKRLGLPGCAIAAEWRKPPAP